MKAPLMELFRGYKASSGHHHQTKNRGMRNEPTLWINGCYG